MRCFADRGRGANSLDHHGYALFATFGAVAENIVLAAEGAGKHKTVSQIVCICANLVLICYPHWTAGDRAYGDMIFGAWLPLFTEITEWIAVLLTIYSGGLYLWNNRQIFLEDR